jgi:predicted nucleic-acid-binding protein
MRAVDTNLLVRIITRDDVRQTAAADAFIATVGWVEQHLTIQDVDVVTAALEEYRRHPRVGFWDCLVLAIARKAGHLPVGTFDRQRAKI